MRKESSDLAILLNIERYRNPQSIQSLEHVSLSTLDSMDQNNITVHCFWKTPVLREQFLQQLAFSVAH